MDIKTKDKILELWDKDIFENLYIFTGEEFFLKEELFDYLKKRISSNFFDFFIFSGDNIEINSFIMDCQTAPLFLKKKIIILKRAHKLKSESFKKLMDYLKHPCETLCLIMSYDRAITPRDPLYNEFLELKGIICEFNRPDLDTLKNYIIRKFSLYNKTISEENALLLLEITDNTPAIISGEIEKLILYTGERKEIKDKDILESAAGIKGENPFRIINLLLNRQTRELEKLVENLISNETEPLFIISLILNALDKILKILRIEKNGLSNNWKLIYSLGIYKNEISKADNFRNISEEKIITLINKCLEIEYLLKTSVDKNQELYIQNLIYQIDSILFRGQVTGNQ